MASNPNIEKLKKSPRRIEGMIPNPDPTLHASVPSMPSNVTTGPLTAEVVAQARKDGLISDKPQEPVITAVKKMSVGELIAQAKASGLIEDRPRSCLRLPPGSTKTITWTGTQWTGTMNVPSATFEATGRSELGCCRKLHAKFERWLERQEAAK